jgi:hypothetical protein
MASPAPNGQPPRQGVSGWVYGLIGCLVVFLVALAAGVVVVVFVWHPWKPDLKPPPGGETTLTEEGTEPTETTEEGTEPGDATTTTGTSTLSVEAGNGEANGAAFKLFDEAGAVLASGAVPMAVDLPAGSRCKLVASRPGYRTWEGWQVIGAAGSLQSAAVRLERMPANLVSLVLCSGTGRTANPWCPTTSRRDFRVGEEPGVCTVHRAPTAQTEVVICTATARRANRYCPSKTTRVYDIARAPGYCMAHRPPQQTVTETICLDTGRLATQHCPRVGQKQFAVGSVPGFCTTHKPPPPPPPPQESTISVRVCDGSGMKSGPYCPSTHVEERPRSDVPSRCQLHAEPPPKPPDEAEQYKWCPECNARNRVNARLCRKCNHRF